MIYDTIGCFAEFQKKKIVFTNIGRTKQGRRLFLSCIEAK